LHKEAAEEERPLAAVAEQVAPAIDHASREELLRSLQESMERALAAICGRPPPGEDAPSFVQHLCEAIATLVGARRCAFWRVGPDGLLAVEPQPYGFTSDLVLQLRLRSGPAGEPIPEQVSLGADGFCSDPQQRGIEAFAEALEALQAQDFLAVGCRDGKQVLGMLAAYDSEAGFGEHEAWLLRLAANAAGLAWQYRQAEAELGHVKAVLEKITDSRRRLLQRLATATEQERKRMARDIHDDSLQALTAAELRLQRLRSTLVEPSQRALLEEVEAMVRRTDDGLRRLVFDLRPPALDLPGGLKSALREYLDHFRADLRVSLELKLALADDLPVDTSQLIYRILQEALTNIAKHARASHVRLLLEEQGQGVHAVVTDDGRGFLVGEAQVAPGHIGLTSLRERVELAGGWCQIESQPGAGTRVEVWVPPTPRHGLMTSIKVLIVEDYQLVAEGLRALLEDEPDIEVVGQAASAAEAVRLAQALAADVVLIDYRLPDGSGAEVATAIRRLRPHSALLFLSREDNELARLQALEAGASGYLLKSQAATEVVNAVRRASRGEMLISGSAIADLLARRRQVAQLLQQLTRRELEVLCLVAQGVDNHGIASRLGIRYGTVRSHVRNLIAKLGAHSKMEAVVRGRELGLIEH